MLSSSSSTRSSTCSPSTSSTSSMCWRVQKPQLRPSGRRLSWPSLRLRNWWPGSVRRPLKIGNGSMC
eukprot:7027419-Alexandrium_andersonii.AAC.1